MSGPSFRWVCTGIGKAHSSFLTGETPWGKQHHQSTGTDQPGAALSFKLEFLANREEKVEELEAETQQNSNKK
jgi:hypothetical protein